MAKDDNYPRRERESSLFGKLVKTLIFSLFCGIVLEWLLIYFYRPELGASYAKEVMSQELSYFKSDFQKSLFISEPLVKIQEVLIRINDYLWVKSGLGSYLGSGSVGKKGLSLYLYQYLGVYLEAMVYVIMIFVIRLFIIVLTAPLFVMVSVVGVIDGLVQRDVRKFGFGRESSFKYHHAKKAITPSLLIFAIIYLSIPFSIHPSVLLVPSSLLFGLTIYLAIFNFKKYL